MTQDACVAIRIGNRGAKHSSSLWALKASIGKEFNASDGEGALILVGSW